MRNFSNKHWGNITSEIARRLGRKGYTEKKLRENFTRKNDYFEFCSLLTRIGLAGDPSNLQ